MGHWTPKTKQKLCVYHFCVKFANFEILAVFLNTDKKTENAKAQQKRLSNQKENKAALK